MSGALYSHTTRASGTTLTATIYNNDHTNHITYGDASYLGGYSDTAAQMRTTADPGENGSENLAASITDELTRLRFAIYECKQALDPSLTYWYETPVDLAGQIRLPPWYIDGLEITVAPSSPGYIEVATGVCRSADNTINMHVSSPLHRTVTALWATAATGGGVGVTWAKFVPYHVFVIKTGASNFDIGFDTVLTASNILARASGTKYRRIGSVNTATTAGTMRALRQDGNEISLYAPGFQNPSLAGVTPSGAQAHVRVQIAGLPTGLSLKARIHAWATAGNTAAWYFGDGNVTDLSFAPDFSICWGTTDVARLATPQQGYYRSNASGDLAYAAFYSAQPVRYVLLGWQDERK